MQGLGGRESSHRERVGDPLRDEALLGAWRDGDRSAAAVLIARYTDDLVRFFRGKVDDDPEELLQETLTGCLVAARQGRPIVSVRAYLFGVARHRLLDHFRAHRRGVDPLSMSVVDLTSSASTKLARQEQRDRVQAALRTIPVDLQLLLELYHWEELSASELAAVFEIPEGTVRSRLRRAGQLLRERLA